MANGKPASKIGATEIIVAIVTVVFMFALIGVISPQKFVFQTQGNQEKNIPSSDLGGVGNETQLTSGASSFDVGVQDQQPLATESGTKLSSAWKNFQMMPA